MPRRRTQGLTGRAGVHETTFKGRPAFYRITGYRNAAGAWVIRNPKNGHWYATKDGRHRAKPPTVAEVRASEHVNIEIYFDGEVHHAAVPGWRLSRGN